MLSAMFDVNQGLSIGSMLVLMLCAAACGLLIAITAMLTGQCSRGFAASLVTLPVVVQAVILMVNGNVGTGVAVLGAFSLVRFRSVPGSSRDITLIFLAMGTGLATSMAYTGVCAAAHGSGVRAASGPALYPSFFPAASAARDHSRGSGLHRRV